MRHNPSAPRPDLSLLPHASSQHLHRALAATAKLTRSGPYQGWLSVGDHRAEFVLEPNHAIRVSLPVAGPLSPGAALQASSQAASNVRFARTGRGLELLADARSDRPDLVRSNLSEIRRGFLQLLGGDKPDSDSGSDLDSDSYSDSYSDSDRGEARIRTILDGMRWEPQSVVDAARGWELRPRLNGDAVAVQLQRDEATSGLRLWRRVLPTLDSTDAVRRRATTELALRLNAELRMARLVDREGALFCEARLRSDPLDPAWLALTSRAVAVGSRHAEQRLQLVASDADVAAWYDRLLGEQAEACKSLVTVE